MDSDDEVEGDQGKPGPNGSQRRRRQYDIFERWLVSDSGQEALVTKFKEAKMNDVADEELSMRALMSKDSENIIKNPREYQRELFERAKVENTIAVLDTGSGKTLIAVLLLRWTIDEELERRAAGKAPRISFFLVASVTLAYQQFSVLEHNLDHKVARICGPDNAETWVKSRWLDIFAENKVLVCTAAVLEHCLSKGYITMQQINLLIFDEAHHAKKHHTYARLIKDFYLSASTDHRPRIFGMTASPIDAKSDVNQAASELEAILHSKIATTKDMSLTDAVKRPKEEILEYPALNLPYETRLLQAVKARYGHIDVFQRFFDRCPAIARELGSWCADQYLVSKLSQRRLRTYETAVERRFRNRTQQDSVPERDRQLAEVKAAISFMEAEHSKLETSAIEPSSLSSKVMILKDYLDLRFEQRTAHRCIVFVDRRDAARLLGSLFAKIGTPHMRSAYLIGGTNSFDEDTFSFRQQVMTLIKFRKAEINCLFATSVAEEGLDVPDCNIVIRFDMYKTMIQYVQSRGRARKESSKFIHMVELGNITHQQVVWEVGVQEEAMRDFCQALPDDRRLFGNEDCLEALISKESEMEVHVEALTGAKLTYGNAMVYLAHFVSAVPTESDEPQHPTYVLTARASRFVCEILLPGSGPMPVRSVMGKVCTKKILAKRSAAFAACLELRSRGLLDAHLMPTYQKKLPAYRNALLAVNAKKTNQYTMRSKPSIWEQTRGELPNELWLTLVDFPDGLNKSHQPIALLTRSQMPKFPPFPIYMDDGRESEVVSQQFLKTLCVGAERLRKLTAFTLRVFKDVFSKTYEDDASKLSYWLAPVVHDASDTTDTAADSIIDWGSIQEVFENEKYPWTQDTPNESFLDRFLVDEGDGSRKFYSVALSKTLNPRSPVPADAVKYKWNENILEYSVSLWKKARERMEWDPLQPVIEAEKLTIRRNLLATPDTKERDQRTKAYLCPQPLKISALRPAIVATCNVWPAIIHRFESYMIALEGANMVGLECEPSIALATFTKDSDDQGEDEENGQFNFRSGMGDNYERFEWLGDSFLKTATTISTFIQNPNDDEFDFHVKRMRLLCNKNLFEVACELRLYEYIRSMSFSRRLWYPEGMKLLYGKGANKKEEEVMKHRLAQKTIADVSEALIGAMLLNHDRPSERWSEGQWEHAVRAVTKLTTLDNAADPEMPKHSMLKWDDYRKAYEKPRYQTSEVTASQLDLAQKVELEHPYKFRYPPLLRVAFIHPSQPFSHERLPNYQRMEFLGDSLLDMASIEHLFHRFPDKDPQWLTEHKMAMVSNKFLGCVCVNLGFHKHLRHSHGALEHQITSYATELLEARRIAGESRDYWTTVSDPPKCLPDIIESYVGAIFIDSDFDYNVVQDFFDRNIKWYFEDMSVYDTYANNHPCVQLHNLMQVEYGCQDYRMMVKELPGADRLELDRKDVVAAVMIHDEIIAHSKGKSGRYAEVRAANNAVEKIEGLAPYEFRARFGCNCAKEAEVEETNGYAGVDCGV